MDLAWKVHRGAEKDRFEWIEQERRALTYDEIRSWFTRCLAAVIEGLMAMTCSRSGQVRTIVVGAGGGAELVSVSTVTAWTGLKIVPLSEVSSKLLPAYAAPRTGSCRQLAPTN